MSEEENNVEDFGEVEKTVGKAVLKKLKEKADLYGISVDWKSIKDETDLKFIANAVSNAVNKMEERIDEKGDFLAEEKRKALQKTSPQGASGVVPLSGSQLEGIYTEGEYSSYSEMFADLHRQLHHGNKQEKHRAKEILGKLSHKALKALKDKNQRINIVVPTDEQIKAGITTVDLINNWWEHTKKKET